MRSTEYSPAQLAAFEAAEQQQQHSQLEPLNQRFYWQSGTVFAVLGLGALVLVYQFSLDQQLYVLGGCLLAFGLLQYLASQLKKQQFSTDPAASQANTGMLVQIVDDLFSMPQRMKQLAVVQFFSWFALFAMWIYTTAAVTSVHYGSSDPTSAAYNDGADWVGLLFAIYNGFAAIAAIVIPWVVKRSSLQISHSLNLLCGALGLLSFLWIKDPALLWLSMIGVGIAWASILSLPYALLADSLPSHKMGVYMGMFNFFIVLPQLLAAAVLGSLLKVFFHGEAIYALALGAGSLLIAALYVLTIKNSHP